MDARRLSALAVVTLSFSSLAASFRTENFIVTARTASFARRVAEAAEQYRHELAISWLGQPLPRWRDPCPIEVHDSPTLGAGGVTTFYFDNGRPFGWEMVVQGSQARILDSVLPHEITHTIFATHFGRPLPRWADEGACTTVEDISERSKQHKMLIDFLLTNRGIAFNKMFAMKEYPRDIMPLYAQGYSLARFLIQQGGRRKFVEYIGQGMDTNNWTQATHDHYGYSSLGELQNAWLAWVKRGSPRIAVPIAARPASLPVAPAREPTAAGVPISANTVAATRSAGGTQELVDVQLNPPAAAGPATMAPFTPGTTGRVALAVGSRPASRSPSSVSPYQLTRPQSPQQPSQQILEWSARR